MDVQANKIAATSAGHEGHGVHHCRRCGWPFPKPHPSSKHRRAHKRVCGTIEGYKIIHSEDHDISDDDHASDDDEHHTPSPNIVKKDAEKSSGVGEKSAKSEDDVFSDAAMDFSDSGISPKLEARFESVRELGKSSEDKSVELDGDLYGSGELEIEGAAETTEQSNDARSEEIRKPGPLSNGSSHPDNVMPITDTTAEMVPVGVLNDSQPEHGLDLEGEMIRGHGADIQVQEQSSASVGLLNDSQPEHGLEGEMIRGHGADIQVQERDSASVSLDPEEGKVLDQTIAAGESQDESCDKFVSEGAKDDSPPPSESLQTDASDEVNSLVHSAERSTSIKTAEAALVDETRESLDASAVNKEVSHATENIGSTESAYEYALPEESLLSMSLVKPNESTKTLDITEHSDAACTVSSIDKEEMPKTSLDASGGNGEKSDMTGGYESQNQSLESKNLNSVDTNSALGSTGNAIPCEDVNTTVGKKDVDHCEQNTNITTLETGNENGGVSAEVEVIPDSTMPSEKQTDFPSSCVVDGDVKSLQELSENNSSSLKFKDDGFENSIEGDGADDSAGAGSKANEVGDALDKSSSPKSSLEHQNNVPVATKVVEVEPLDVAETVCKLEDDNAVLVSAETPEHSISEESTLPLSDSVLLSESNAKDGSSIGEDYKVSESFANAEVAAEDHESNVGSREISESPTPHVQGTFPTSTCLNVTSADAKQLHSSDDLSTLKSVDIITSAEHSFDGKVLKSDECFESSEAPSLKQPIPSPSPSEIEDFHETSDTVDDKSVVIVEDVTRVDPKSVNTDVDCKPTRRTDDASAVDISASSLASRSDSLEANCGSVVSDTLETNSQKHKIHSNKSDTFEPPSFMTLVQSGSEGDQVTAATEIETVQSNQQQPKSDALQAGWFPSLTNVVNESEGRKKNEEIIAKVTNWSPVKQQHSPLKSLLNEVKSPNTKQAPVANQKVEAETKDDNVGSVAATETHTTKDQDTIKHVEEWNSPARYPIEIKKEKKKGRPFWVPFVCCSSAHRDL
ncbi:uncharacterized protein LOC130992548 [Salvia miltiorrhiza]|uniref:uncharacterized protein LOC130992548 n=1 Tax=Salvia miltiorrhiza TaxID=226208 RepID=UPI0025AB6138|nr:uncharacterized protein LOC130992548 [Salvia miltiorrhiza]